MAKRKNRKVTAKKSQMVKTTPTANRNYKDTIYNGNMPLRDLFYISSEYQKLVDYKSLYSSHVQKIPAPSFLVFYNGTEKDDDRWENYLSEAYENSTGEPNLELKVITLNINEGHNGVLMEQCQILKEYAQYVTKVRQYAKEMKLDVAVECAVKECIQEGILTDFLRKNKAEVVAMSIFEYDKEKEEKMLRKAEYEAGYNSGKIEGKMENAISFYRLGLPISRIAEGLKIPTETVLEWINKNNSSETQ